MKHVFVRERSSPYTCMCTYAQNIYIHMHSHYDPISLFSLGTGLKSHDHAIAATTTSGTSFAASVEQSSVPTKSVVVQWCCRDQQEVLCCRTMS